MTKHTGERSERLEMRVDSITLAQLDDLRRATTGDVPSRADVIRSLIHRAHQHLMDGGRPVRTDQTDLEDLPGVRQMIGTKPRKQKR